MRPFGLVAIVLFCAANASAQPAGEVTFVLPMQWTSSEGEEVTRQQRVGSGAAIDYLFGGERGRAFYEMTVDTFGAPDAMRTWLHNAGLTGTFGDERRSFEVGGSAFWRANEGTWADAGFRGVNLLASVQSRPRARLIASASYAFYARGFTEQDALDQLEHRGTWRALLNLPSRTTLVGQFSLARKAYDGEERIVVKDAASTPTHLSGTEMGRGWRQGSFLTIRTETIGEPGSRTEWTWTARVAQSLDDRTGVWVEREERRTAGDLPPAIVWTPPLFYDDGVYDDPFVIDAKTWRAGVKHVFPRGDEIHSSVSYGDRRYAGLERTDALTRATIEAVFPLRSGQTQVDAIVGLSYFRNHSSEVLEDYRAHQFTAGLRLGF